MSSGEGEKNSIRLLDVDSRAVLPYGVSVRALITSADVLHSWALPSVGVKADAVPGRVNQVNIFRVQPRVLFGQCREICGAGHSLIPIVVEFISPEDFVE